jgi:hypothetical protein
MIQYPVQVRPPTSTPLCRHGWLHCHWPSLGARQTDVLTPEVSSLVLHSHGLPSRPCCLIQRHAVVCAQAPEDDLTVGSDHRIDSDRCAYPRNYHSFAAEGVVRRGYFYLQATQDKCPHRLGHDRYCRDSYQDWNLVLLGHHLIQGYASCAAHATTHTHHPWGGHHRRLQGYLQDRQEWIDVRHFAH